MRTRWKFCFKQLWKKELTTTTKKEKKGKRQKTEFGKQKRKK